MGPGQIGQIERKIYKCTSCHLVKHITYIEYDYYFHMVSMVACKELADRNKHLPNISTESKGYN